MEFAAYWYPQSEKRASSSTNVTMAAASWAT